MLRRYRTGHVAFYSSTGIGGGSGLGGNAREIPNMMKFYDARQAGIAYWKRLDKTSLFHKGV